MNFDKSDLLLYAVTDRAWLNGATLTSRVAQAIEGGATMIQLREKNLDDATFLEEAIEIQQLCRAHHIPFIVNDNVEIALRMHADGIHVGQSDMEARDVIDKLGNDIILGVSVQTVEQAIEAEQCGADYLGVGAVFPTGTKDDAENVGYETLKAICEAVSIPVVAIGGISGKNVHRLAGSGISGIAVISAVFAQKDIRKATAELKMLTVKMLKG